MGTGREAALTALTACRRLKARAEASNSTGSVTSWNKVVRLKRTIPTPDLRRTSEPGAAGSLSGCLLYTAL